LCLCAGKLDENLFGQDANDFSRILSQLVCAK
jgi:hypothetical protein